MNIRELIKNSVPPPLYEKGNSFMWNEEHITRKLLEIHLNPDIDLGSRKKSTIIKTAEWIMSLPADKDKLKILDLGCGPGLYTEIYAQNDHNVTGIDISKTSIEYARESAKERELKIEYINADYIKADLPPDTYDLITLIYTDLGVLNPDERDILLKKIFLSLKKGGIFIFDVLRDRDLEKRTAQGSWECAQNGFWKAEPYLVLSNSFLYDKQKVILYQHIVIDEADKINIYRFWTHFFSEADISKMLAPYKFSDISYKDNVLPEGDIWNGDNVLFTIAKK